MELPNLKGQLDTAGQDGAETGLSEAATEPTGQLDGAATEQDWADVTATERAERTAGTSSRERQKKAKTNQQNLNTGETGTLGHRHQQDHP